MKWGDKIYPLIFGKQTREKGLQVGSVYIGKDEISFTTYDEIGAWKFSIKDYNKTWFTDRAKAEEFCKLKKNRRIKNESSSRK